MERKIFGKSKLQRTMIDILLVILLIAISMCVRLPSLTVDVVKDSEAKELFLTDEGVPYLYDPDSYFYLRLGEKYLDGSANGLFLEDDRLSHSLLNVEDRFPGGMPFFAAFLYRIVSVVIPISFYKFIVFFAPFVSSLAAIPAYVFVRKRFGVLGGVTAGLLASVGIPFAAASLFATFDTDCMLCVLPLTQFCFFAEAMDAKRTSSRIVYSVLCAFFAVWLGVTWGTHTIYCVMLLLSFVLLLPHLIFYKRKDLKHLVFSGEFCGAALSVGLSFLFLLLFNVDTSISGMLNMVVKISGNGGVGYPDDALFISELKALPFLVGNPFDAANSGSLNRLGGPFVLAAAVLTFVLLIVLSIIHEVKNEKNPYFSTLAAFSVLMIAGFVVIPRSVRLLEFTVIPFAIFAGIGIGLLYKFLKKRGLAVCSVILAVSIVFTPLFGLWYISAHSLPYVNDDLATACDFIKENAPEDTVIVSWWDNGYVTEYESGRKSAADGGTFDNRYFYWLGSAFMSEDPLESAAIFRMLAYGATKASAIADRFTGDVKTGSELIRKLLLLNEEDALAELENAGMEKEEARSLAKLTHPPKDYHVNVLVDSRTVMKYQAISYYGYWDFSGNGVSAQSLPKDSMLCRLFYCTDGLEGFENVYSSAYDAHVSGVSVWNVS